MEKQIEEMLSSGYKSPIEMIMGQMRTEVDNGVYKAVQGYGINVDKDELIRALQYDRGQFDAGYKARDNEIVRCKDCAVPHNKWLGCPHLNGKIPPPDFYCARGERRMT